MIATLVAGLMLGQGGDLPQPLVRWVLDESRIVEGTMRAVAGPDPEVSGFPKPVESPWGPAMEVAYEHQTVKIPWFVRREWADDPKENFTVSVAFRVDRAVPSERLAGCIFSVEGRMVGWQLLMVEGRPVFEVGHPTGSVRVESREPVVGKWTWVSATYSGSEARLEIDGREVGRVPAAFGPLPYNGRAPLAVSGFWHGSGSMKFRGAIREFRVDKPTLSVSQVRRLHGTAVPVPPMPPAAPEPLELKWGIAPYLQAPRAGGVTLSFETSRTTTATVWHGSRPTQMDQSVRTGPATIHHARLEGLPAGSPWFYRVEVSDGGGQSLKQDVTAFRTLPGREQTVRFVVTADTQSSPDRTVRVAAAMWDHRPDFVVVVGDLVGEGWLKQNWQEHFFSSMRPLLNHVPLVPVLGNHERNARLYYIYMDVPEPKFYYSLESGPVDLFIVDTEQDTSPGSEQYAWLERALGASRAPWKVGFHHYPAYSSGYASLSPGADFGGDTQALNLVPLYDRFGATAVMSGHVHQYERTFPMRGGQVSSEGVTYFTLGGGGGGLTSNPTPWRFDFSKNRRTAHHFALVTATASEFHVQVYDWDNQLFDEWKVRR